MHHEPYVAKWRTDDGSRTAIVIPDKNTPYLTLIFNDDCEYRKAYVAWSVEKRFLKQIKSHDVKKAAALILSMPMPYTFAAGVKSILEQLLSEE